MPTILHRGSQELYYGGAMIIDTHVHLWPTMKINKLPWQLRGEIPHLEPSFDEYLDAVLKIADVANPYNIRLSAGSRYSIVGHAIPRPLFLGAVLIESNSISSLEPAFWAEPLNKIHVVSLIAAPQGDEEKGGSHMNANLCKAMIPWAPLASGVGPLEIYKDMAFEAAGIVKHLIKGWTCDVRSKADGNMLRRDFIESLRALGRWNQIFELELDHGQKGLRQVGEVYECLLQVYDGVPDRDQVVVVINNMCKPDMRSADLDLSWRTAIQKLSTFSKTFIKLSGGFSGISQLPNGVLISENFSNDEGSKKKRFRQRSKRDKKKLEIAQERRQNSSRTRRQKAWEDRLSIIHRHLDVLWEEFGPERCMFGSDWPISEVGYNEEGEFGGMAWLGWLAVIEEWTKKRGLRQEDRHQLYRGVAMNVYSLAEDEWESELVQRRYCLGS